MIHPGERATAIMLDMAARALLRLGVETGGLLVAERCAGMACYASGRFDSDMRRVAGFAIGFERLVRPGELARPHHPRPEGNGAATAAMDEKGDEKADEKRGRPEGEIE